LRKRKLQEEKRKNTLNQEIDILSLQRGVYFVSVGHSSDFNLTVSKVIKVE